MLSRNLPILPLAPLFVGLGILSSVPLQAHSRPGVTLYADDGFLGASETFTSDVPDLGATRFGNDRASSIRVDQGCRAVLFRHSDYRGDPEPVLEDVPRLSWTSIGNDELSSLTVDCWNGWDEADPRGVVVFDDIGFRGAWQWFPGDALDLRDEPIGNDHVSSLKVAPGCRATLWTDAGYRGRSWTVRGDIADLRRTPLGNDRLSSLEVRCRSGGYGPHHDGPGDHHTWPEEPDSSSGDPSTERGVILFEHAGFRGFAIFLGGDVSDLGHLERGNDEISSVRVSPGCEAVLWSDARFRGRSLVVRSEISELGRTPVGNDTVSSVEVRCGRRRSGW